MFRVVRKYPIHFTRIKRC